MNSIFLNRVPKAILFSGIHGTGKTTLARLYAKALNCTEFRKTGEVCNTCLNCINFSGSPFIVELDAASNNGVDDIRDLQERVKMIADVPYKVIILDECHMLSTQAQAAFLKLLEEPESNRVFLLVTTNPDKLHPTVRSRCLSMPLKPLTGAEVAMGITNILQVEGISYTPDFVTNLSTQCNGSLRDTLQVLEQIIMHAAGSTLDLSILENSLGIVTSEQYMRLSAVFSWIGHYNTSLMQRGAVEHVTSWDQAGVDLRQLFLEGLPKLLRDYSVYFSGASVPLLSGLDRNSLQFNFTLDDVKMFLREWEVLEEMMRTTKEPRLIWELYFITVL
jgi:DNA polymerase III subunit gamma/tau